MIGLLLFAGALAVEPLLLDAGGLTSPLQEGFARLHLEGAEEPRVHWQTPPSAVRVRGGPDPLLADHLDGGTLALELEPGRWWGWLLLGSTVESARAYAGMEPVRVRSGDRVILDLARDQPWSDWTRTPWAAAAPRPVFRPHETAWHRQIAPRHRWHPVQLEVPGEGSTLTVTGLPLHALVLYPEDRAPEGEVWLAMIDAARSTWWARHRHPENAASRPPRATRGALGLVMHLDAAGIAWDRPGTELPMALAADDRGLRYLQILGGDEPGSLSVTGPEGLTLELAEVSWLDAAGHPSRPLVPRPLVVWPGRQWIGGQGLTPVMALVVRNTGASPGRHEIVITAGRGERTATTTLAVEIARAKLHPGAPMGLFFSVPRAPTLRTGSGSAVVVDVLDRALRTLADLGITATSLRGATDDGEPILQHVRELWRALGGRVLVWSDPKVRWRASANSRRPGPALRTDHEDEVRDLLAATQTDGLEIWLHAWEEEVWTHLASLPRAEPLLQTLRRLAPGVPLLGTLPTSGDRQIASLLDIGLVGPTHGSLALAVEEVRAAGAQAWTYNLSPGRAAPWQSWAAGAAGHLQWHAWPRTDDPFDDTVSPVVWRHLLLGPGGEVLVTSQLLELAQGIADARLLTTVAASRPRADRLTEQIAFSQIDLRPTGAPYGRDPTAEALETSRLALVRALRRGVHARRAPFTR